MKHVTYSVIEPVSTVLLVLEINKIMNGFDFIPVGYPQKKIIVTSKYLISDNQEPKLFSLSTLNESDLKEIGCLGSKLVKILLCLDGITKVEINKKGLRITLKDEYSEKIKSCIKDVIETTLFSYVKENNKK